MRKPLAVLKNHQGQFYSNRDDCRVNKNRVNWGSATTVLGRGQTRHGTRPDARQPWAHGLHCRTPRFDAFLASVPDVIYALASVAGDEGCPISSLHSLCVRLFATSCALTRFTITPSSCWASLAPRSFRRIALQTGPDTKST